MSTVSTSVIVVICLFGLIQALNLQSAIFNSDPEKNWAVLVAGSDGWSNYRHQSDVCHAYQILAGLGIPKENIITFMYDDIANNEENPYPGKIFNDYNHKDVYSGVQIDYKGSDVNPKVFMQVMKGDLQLKAAGRKVLERNGGTQSEIYACWKSTGPQDNVFVFFSDHGGEGLICFPEDDLYARQLNETITYMYENKRYNQMVIYIEACYSGSMFRGILSPSIQVYATTAANPSESSWATFCEDKTIDTCLADEYSYNWMVDTETHDTHNWTLNKQFKNVKQATKLSHVKKYGNKSKVADSKPSVRAHLIRLMRSVMSATTEDEHDSAKRRLHRALQMGTIVEHTFDDIITEVEKRYKPSGNQIDKLEQLKCFEAVFEVFKRYCFTIQQVPEVAQHVSKLHQLCRAGYQPEDLVDSVMHVCA
ncbi:hypothetical protein EG68_11120 [Paragonimus skrjabini miyazakii]|uniref:Hemoglobinase n=1 Tax=Paragonimus skrjabini miyazakii TaxID=59628 RepID=A0A8S9YK54_9TREM|nr:hypothetical protein EG68_11120 [Paragonimus skrjabini miyazakii]